MRGDAGPGTVRGDAVRGDAVRGDADTDDWTLRQPVTARSGVAPPAGMAIAGRRIPLWRIALIIVAILAIAELAYLIVRTLQPAAGVAMTGTLVVESAPVGAEIYIDGVLKGRTPFRADLAAGAHALEVRSGDLRRTRTVTLQAGALVSHMVELAAPPASGADRPGRRRPSRCAASLPARASASAASTAAARRSSSLGSQPGRHQLRSAARSMPSPGGSPSPPASTP